MLSRKMIYYVLLVGELWISSAVGSHFCGTAGLSPGFYFDCDYDKACFRIEILSDHRMNIVSFIQPSTEWNNGKSVRLPDAHESFRALYLFPSVEYELEADTCDINIATWSRGFMVKLGMETSSDDEAVETRSIREMMEMIGFAKTRNPIGKYLGKGEMNFLSKKIQFRGKKDVFKWKDRLLGLRNAKMRKEQDLEGMLDLIFRWGYIHYWNLAKRDVELLSRHLV